ncbi:MAG: cadherin repeat domain-containing protein [Pirellulaceae bacterium]|nr:cadherin repeat domain-containing protein [Pirellulaceae bacterium]
MLSDIATVTLSIHPTNDAPSDITLDNTTISENDVAAVVGNLSVVDPDSGDTHLWSVDDGRFEIVGTHLKLKTGESLDKESEPTVNLTVTATDQGGTGLAFNEAFVITVDNVNEAPTDITLDNTSVNENADGAVVGNLGVADPDTGDAHTWSVDDVRFEIVAGQLKLKTGQSLNMEAEPTVNLTITATDQSGAGLDYDEAFVITVDNVNEAPTDITLDNTGVNENADGAVIGNLGVADPDTGDAHTWSVDDVRFEIVSDQLQLKTGQSLDYEAEPTVNVTIAVTDQAGSGLVYEETFVITVTDVNDTPVITAVPPTIVNPEPKTDETPEESLEESSEESEEESEDDSDDDDENETVESAVPGAQANVTGDAPEAASDIMGVVDVDSPTMNNAAAMAPAIGSELNPDAEKPSDPDRSSASESESSTSQRSTRRSSRHASTSVDRALMSKPGAMWNALDQQMNQVESQIQGDLIVVGAAGAAASSFTVGAVAWAIRTGFLASGLLAQTPAWAAFDPLTVMRGFEGADDEETLQELMNRRTESLNAHAAELANKTQTE